MRAALLRSAQARRPRVEIVLRALLCYSMCPVSVELLLVPACE